MNPDGRNSVANVSGAQGVLADLCRPFVPGNFIAECDAVVPNSVPEPAHSLLVHKNHMTVELERHYGKPVEVGVQDEQLDGDSYTRKIELTLRGTSHVVERGIARLNLRHLSQPVREEILAKQSPLGAILIKHQVYRRIEPRYFIRLPALSPVIEIFGAGYNPAPVYGRLGIIHCNEEPAIEVLEIVVNTEGVSKG